MRLDTDPAFACSAGAYLRASQIGPAPGGIDDGLRFQRTFGSVYEKRRGSGYALHRRTFTRINTALNGRVPQNAVEIKTGYARGRRRDFSDEFGVLQKDSSSRDFRRVGHELSVIVADELSQ